MCRLLPLLSGADITRASEQIVTQPLLFAFPPPNSTLHVLSVLSVVNGRDKDRQMDDQQQQPRSLSPGALSPPSSFALSLLRHWFAHVAVADRRKRTDNKEKEQKTARDKRHHFVVTSVSETKVVLSRLSSLSLSVPSFALTAAFGPFVGPQLKGNLETYAQHLPVHGETLAHLMREQAASVVNCVCSLLFLSRKLCLFSLCSFSVSLSLFSLVCFPPSSVGGLMSA